MEHTEHFIVNVILVYLGIWSTGKNIPQTISACWPIHGSDEIVFCNADMLSSIHQIYLQIVPLFSTEHSKGKLLALSQELL